MSSERRLDLDRDLIFRIGEEVAGLRHTLHRWPELSGGESGTAGLIAGFLEETGPAALYRNIGGHGVAAVYDSGLPGPAVMFRAELDALPIADEIEAGYRSENDGAGHKCGHDGHMAVLAGLGMYFGEHPPAKGRAILLFQPSEETGEGAQRILADPLFASLKPDYAFAFHNLPGVAKKRVVIRDGVFASASRGFIARLKGMESHAAYPEQGRNPALAMASLIAMLSQLPAKITSVAEVGLPIEPVEDDKSDLTGDTVLATEFALVTPVYARLGEKAFGTSAGYAEVMATFRSFSDTLIQRMADEAESMTVRLGKQAGLETSTDWTEEFAATINHPDAADRVRGAAIRLGLDMEEPAIPYPWSEDFGRFGDVARCALFGIGAGENHHDLHTPGYDYPDDITETAIFMFLTIAKSMLDLHDK